MQGAVIGRYERDEVRPSIEVAAKIAQALGMSLDYLGGSSDMLLGADGGKKLEKNKNLFLYGGIFLIVGGLIKVFF